MTNTNRGKPALDVSPHAAPRQVVLLTSASQDPPPAVLDHARWIGSTRDVLWEGTAALLTRKSREAKSKAQRIKIKTWRAARNLRSEYPWTVGFASAERPLEILDIQNLTTTS
jgi:hypothetical protein